MIEGAILLTCKFCDWLCDRFCPPDADHASFWKKSYEWERTHSNEGEIWSNESDGNRKLVEAGLAVYPTDQEAAFRLYLEAADAGSIWAMEAVGWAYEVGGPVQADFAQSQEYYYRALCAGSWMATIKYARLLEKHGYREYWEHVLRDGVRADFVPAYFWLAWFLYKHLQDRSDRDEIRRLLEYAAEQGHPGAELMLMRLLIFGKLGIGFIPQGFRLFRRRFARFLAKPATEAHPT